MFVLDDHTQEWVFLDALFQRRNEGLSRSDVYIFTCNLVDCCYEKGVVITDVLTTDCADFIGTCIPISALTHGFNPACEIVATNLRVSGTFFAVTFLL